MAKNVTMISTALLERLLDEFKSSIKDVAKMEEDESLERNDYIVALAKLVGLSTGMVTETTLLVGDVQAIVKAASTGVAPKDYLTQLLNSAIGGGTGPTKPPVPTPTSGGGNSGGGSDVN
jgi:hypothetical protein